MQSHLQHRMCFDQYQVHWHGSTFILPKGQHISRYTWQSPDHKVYYPHLLTTSYQILDINVLAHVYWVPTTIIMWCNTHSAGNSSQLVTRILIIPTLHHIITKLLMECPINADIVINISTSSIYEPSQMVTAMLLWLQACQHPVQNALPSHLTSFPAYEIVVPISRSP